MIGRARHVLVPFVAVATLLATSAASAAPSAAPKKVASRHADHLSKGAPNHGSLEGAQRWKDRAWAKHMVRHEKAATFALPSLVALVDKAARRVAKSFPKSVLSVGDMSLERGGPISGHHSHQNGRDIDIGFYAADAKGRSVRLVQFSGFDSAGKSMASPDVHFDDARNWTLISTMLDDTRAEVRSVFIASWLRTRLLAHATKIHAPKAQIERAAMVMMQPPNAEPHHDHFHVRIACPASQRGKTCFDDSFARPPIHREDHGASSPEPTDPLQ
jgi:penicillin-insensitive murein endopeptidase